MQKVTIISKDTTASAAWYKKIMGFVMADGSPFTTPFGSVTRVVLEDKLEIEFIESPTGSKTAGTMSAPINDGTNFYYGISQYSFRIQNKDACIAWLKKNNVPILFKFSNAQLQLYLIFVREPTSNTLIEFLQPYDNSTTLTNYDTNPTGITGFSQVTCYINQTVSLTTNYYSKVGNFILPYGNVQNLVKAFGTIINLYEGASVRLEMLDHKTATLGPTGLIDSPPQQASVANTFASYALRVKDLATAKAHVINKLGESAVLYEYATEQWGGSSLWLRDPTGIILELYQPTSKTSNDPIPLTESMKLGLLGGFLGTGVILGASLFGTINDTKLDNLF
jgi:catechol 2,3-dioxygenase-like lactoylglutathione lyase family enzyme